DAKRGPPGAPLGPPATAGGGAVVGAADATAVPHAPQNRAPGVTAAPHAVHGTSSRAPHCSQNRAPKKVVGRDGIEPPTPGFSVDLTMSRKRAMFFPSDYLDRAPPLALVGSRGVNYSVHGHSTGTEWRVAWWSTGVAAPAPQGRDPP